MKIYKVLPDLSKRRHMSLWHKALRAQWSADDLNWSAPHRMTSDKTLNGLARVLTPILMGEQAALYSVSGLIPILGQNSEVESQLYLTTWAVDEARHTELFTLFYNRIAREPLPIRRFPSGYMFQSSIVSQEPAEWLAGVLVSECLAKLAMEEFKRLDLDPVLSEISRGILEDEARASGVQPHLPRRPLQPIFPQGTERRRELQRTPARPAAERAQQCPRDFRYARGGPERTRHRRHEMQARLAEDAMSRLNRSVDAGASMAKGALSNDQVARAERGALAGAL